jgi:hypothetical protein
MDITSKQIIVRTQFKKKTRPTQTRTPIGIFYRRNSVSAQRECYNHPLAFFIEERNFHYNISGYLFNVPASPCYNQKIIHKHMDEKLSKFEKDARRYVDSIHMIDKQQFSLQVLSSLASIIY